MLTLQEEEILIKGCLTGERSAQKSLFDAYAGKMKTLCVRYSKNPFLADDNLQDGFIKVFTNLKQFKGSGSFDGWIRRIFIHTIFRSNSKLKTSIHSEGLEEGVADLHFEENIFSKMNENNILKLIESLPDGYKTVFNLAVIEGFSHKEISELLQIDEATSRSQLFKARKQLRQMLSSLESAQIYSH
jgi:RNA polymerase sigma-70 factor (ECF subfamily)